MIAFPNMQVAVWATDSPMPIHRASGMAATQRQSTCTNNEWFTPAKYVEAAREVMGSIDLDPASCVFANQVVRAKRYYTIDDNGLAQPWYGNVWLNPPYKSDERISLQSLWVGKALHEYRSSNLKQAVLLVTGVTERKWFEPLWDYVVCFPNHQVHFKTLESGKYHHPYGSVFVYLGTNEQVFTDVFSKFGRIAKAIDTPKVQPINLSLWEVQS